MLKKNKKNIICLLLMVCFIFTSCGKTDESSDRNTNEATNTSAEEASKLDAVLEETEVLTEEYEEEYFDKQDVKYDEKIEPGEVYNKNGIVIDSKEFVHTEDDCYVVVEVSNNTEKTLVFSEKSYSLNGRNYGLSEIFDYDYNDGLSTFTIKDGSSSKVKLRLRDVLSCSYDQIVSCFSFLIYTNEKDVKGTLDKIYFEIQTDKYDGIIKYKKNTKIYEDDYFVYEIVSADFNNRLDCYIYQVNVYNKTSKWMRFNLDYLYLNDILMTEADAKFYDELYSDSFKDDYYTTAKDSLLLPYCSHSILIGVDDEKVCDDYDFDEITSVKMDYTYYINDRDEFTVKSNGIEFNPEDY